MQLLLFVFKNNLVHSYLLSQIKLCFVKLTIKQDFSKSYFYFFLTERKKETVRKGEEKRKGTNEKARENLCLLSVKLVITRMELKHKYVHKNCQKLGITFLNDINKNDNRHTFTSSNVSLSY